MTAVDLSLYGLIDPEHCAGRNPAELARIAARNGVTLLQYRDKRNGVREMVEIARAMRAALEGTDIPLLVNDRVDVALAAGADGVHIGQEDMRAEDARRLLGLDAIIGLSVVYKALDNLGAFQRWFGFRPNTRVAVLVFGFFHGFGLATKLQEFELSPDGLVPNILAFNVGVELGQLLALSGILIVMGFWRRSETFARHAFAANTLLMTAGFMLIGYQLTGYFIS